MLPVLAAACSDDDPAVVAGTAGDAATAEAGPAAPLEALTADFGEPLSRIERGAGALTLSWLLPEPSAERVARELAARVERIAGLEVTAAEIASSGGIVVFEGARDGHYVVTRSTEQGTRVELLLDPAPTATAAGTPRAGIELPAGLPLDELPAFPGATVLEAEADGARFVLVQEAAREAIEMVGFYGDHLRAQGWLVRRAGPGLTATRDLEGGGRETVAVTVLGQAPATVRLELARTSAP